MSTCQFEGCVRPVLAKGWCSGHYRHVHVEGHEPRTLRQHGSAIENLWRRVEKTGGCWVWTGAVSSNGYGVLSSGKAGRVVYAHRLAWESTFGPIPEHQEVCHRCDNRRCVRPEHLFLADHRENIADMMRKGRHGSTKLTPEIVMEVVRMREAGVPRQGILNATGIKLGTLKDMLSGRHWGHLTGWGVTPGHSDKPDWWVYVLMSTVTAEVYVGASTNPQRRLRQHNGELTGGALFTQTRRPWVLQSTSGPFSRKDALAEESRLKASERRRLQDSVDPEPPAAS